MPRVGNRRKKRRTGGGPGEDTTQAQNTLASHSHLKIPKSVVIHRGSITPVISELINDLRRTMSPYTAMNLRAGRKNKLTFADYSKQLTGSLGVTHLLCLTQNKQNLFFRIARTPSGPTLGFQVRSFSLMKGVRAVQRRPYESDVLFRNSPIVVTNNFGDGGAASSGAAVAKDGVEPHVKLMRITFQNMFPAVNVATVKLTACRRVVLFDYLTETGEVDVRHYAIRATPVGMTRKVRRIVQCKIPNLGQLDDVADYIMGHGGGGGASASEASDSEIEDEACQVVLPQDYKGKGNKKSSKSALKLVELGPRLRLKLVKVERGLGEGDVMYHSYIKKTEEEKKELKRRVVEKDELKRKRREEQELNVERKLKAKEEKKERKTKRREERAKLAMDELRGGQDSSQQKSDESEDEQSMEDDDGSSSENSEEE